MHEEKNDEQLQCSFLRIQNHILCDLKVMLLIKMTHKMHTFYKQLNVHLICLSKTSFYKLHSDVAFLMYKISE